MSKLYDLAVKTGNYTNRAGEDKIKWENVGSIIETKNGGKVILLKRSFNPAGVPCKENDDSIMLSMFTPKEKEQSRHEESKANGYQPQKDSGSGFDDMADDIPF